MKLSKVKQGMCGTKTIRALLDCGTILGVTREAGSKGFRNSFFINGKTVKNTGISNKVFTKNFDNFAKMVNYLV